MNFFDASIIRFVNSFSQKSTGFDNVIAFVVENDFFKGAIIFSVIWFLWFRKSERMQHDREKIIVSLLASFVAIVVGRLLSMSLPYRIRPVFNPDVTFLRPVSFVSYGLDTWSSFPSDHAVMFFALATGIFSVSKKAGIFTYIYILAVICFPRVYLGFHYPTDIVAGAIVGIVITLVVSIPAISKRVSNAVFKFSEKHQGLFYALFFLLSFQICDMFYETRIIAAVVFKILRGLI